MLSAMGHTRLRHDTAQMPDSRILDLATHPLPYLRLGALARYWGVSRARLLARIKAGALPAVRLGPRLWRVPVEAARLYERQVRVRTTMLPFRRNEAR